MQEQQKRPALFAKRQIQQRTTTNCVMHPFGANFTLCPVASYDRRQRQALSLSPTNSNNYDVPFAPSGAIFLSAIQLNQPKPLSAGIACNPVVARHLRTALQSVRYKTEFFLSRRYTRSVKRCHVTRQVAR
ncbi:hypothetical protein XFF6166_670065 [Xanthomonas citri pv. fuscans]|nr:hypothetical protein XFF6166_670065 [Xanthomonas citri pv. fuscans]SOO01695.1 hypothetical protein XFF6960_520065 [Xanthomonas citri pv. fuscans]SOO04289.1 hypothetical protein XFF7767_240130 [Xanthomonas citri pv. fuscans]SOO08433.1 hypothetical protein XFF6970_210087 [Xanthomonas citri pv. fuscans]SOO16711.1 hypothetical protein XFF7766_850130 [Xanthomonas citri pv. fuscans]